MSIDQLIKDISSKNLAADMDQDALDKLGQEVYDGYEEDVENPKRIKWVESLDEYTKIAMQIMETKSDPWEGCANIKLPLLTEAAVQFNARAYPALVPAGQIAKAKTNGDDADGQKESRAGRVGKHMSYQLHDEMEEWEPEMDKGLLILPILGCFFKKTYRNSDTGKNESRLVMPQKLIMDYDAPCVERAPRKSEEIPLYPDEVIERQASGTWVDAEIQFKDESKQEIETFIEQHKNCSIREGAKKYPYIVTIHRRSKKVVRIVANYTEHDIYYNDGTEVVSVGQVKTKIDEENAEINANNIENAAIAQQAGAEEPPVIVPDKPYPSFDGVKITRVDATKYYTKYSFLPAPDGSIYDIGLGQLLTPLTAAADTLTNQMLDAGTAANLQGGFMAKGVKTPAGTNRVNVTEFTKVETNGQDLRASILPFNFPGPSATAFSLLSFLIESAKGIANLKDILSGDAPQGETATTSMIKREEGMKIYNAIYKRIYKSFKKELRLLYDLNVRFLPEDVYFNWLDSKENTGKKDYSFDDDITPISDPNEATKAQRIMTAEAVLQFANDPDFNRYEVLRNWLEAIDHPNIDKVLPPPSKEPAPPDPNLIKLTAEVQKIEAETKKIMLETAEVISKVIKNLADAESKEVGDQLNMLETHANLLIQKGVANDQGGSTGVAQTPGNSIPQGGVDEGGGQAGGSIEFIESPSNV